MAERLLKAAPGYKLVYRLKNFVKIVLKLIGKKFNAFKFVAIA